jgi:hypothetical protein
MSPDDDQTRGLGTLFHVFFHGHYHWGRCSQDRRFSLSSTNIQSIRHPDFFLLSALRGSSFGHSYPPPYAPHTHAHTQIHAHSHTRTLAHMGEGSQPPSQLLVPRLPLVTFASSPLHYRYTLALSMNDPESHVVVIHLWHRRGSTIKVHTGIVCLTMICATVIT